MDHTNVYMCMWIVVRGSTGPHKCVSVHVIVILVIL